ncbi:hypothetical protein OHO28_29215 [Streptomyces europaeiscabiei]|uniref:hypothetical protein n=1 Tax=Streptomyces europaeiscabiei TaxID=146819 RepID=UPI002E195AA7
MRPPLQWPTRVGPSPCRTRTPDDTSPSAAAGAPARSFHAAADAGAPAVTALHEGLAIVPDKIISEHDSAQQFLGLTPRTTGQWLTQIGL